MNEDFVMGKIREVKGVLSILWGKLTGNDKERIKGSMEALSALEQEIKGYEKEMASAKKKITQEQRDISAI